MYSLSTLLTELAKQTEPTEIVVELHDSSGTDYLAHGELVIGVGDRSTETPVPANIPTRVDWRGRNWTIAVADGYSRQTDTVTVYSHDTGVSLSALETAIDWHEYQLLSHRK